MLQKWYSDRVYTFKPTHVTNFSLLRISKFTCQISFNHVLILHIQTLPHIIFFTQYLS